MIETTHTQRETQGVRPLSQRARILLEAVQNSSNELCASRARMYLTNWEDKMTQTIAQGEGSFMTSCLEGDAKRAWWNADGSNRAVIKEAVFTILTEY